MHTPSTHSRQCLAENKVKGYHYSNDMHARQTQPGTQTHTHTVIDRKILEITTGYQTSSLMLCSIQENHLCFNYSAVAFIRERLQVPILLVLEIPCGYISKTLNLVRIEQKVGERYKQKYTQLTTVKKDTLWQVTAVQYAPLLTAVHKESCNVKVPHVVQHLHYPVKHAH